ncbi:MAG: O-antigen ligase family protein [Caulobacteraceae bacterium]
MTSSVVPFPRPRRGPAGARLTLVEAGSFAAAALMLLIYSQGWEAPFFGAGQSVGDSAVVRAMFLPAYAIGVALMAQTPLRLAAGTLRQPCLIAILLIAALSLAWSVSPDQTSRRVLALFFTTLCGAVLAARFSWSRLAEALASAYVVLALASLVVGLFLPSIGRMSDIFPGSWRGVWLEKNTFGDTMALGSAVCAAAGAMSRPRAGFWWGAAVLCAVMVLMSTSKTALVSMLMGWGALGLVWTVRRGPAAGVAATWSAVVALGLFAGVAVFASDVVFGLLGKNATLTGRTDIWAAVMRQIEQRPWTGWGYGAIWDETTPWGPLAWIVHDTGFKPRHAHNAWLDQWLALGVPGLAAWAGFFLQTLAANVVALYRHKGAYLALPFFVIFSLMSLTESVAVDYNEMRWVIFTALAVKLALGDPPEAGRLRPEQRIPLPDRRPGIG